MLELRAEEVVFCDDCSTLAVGFKGGAVDSVGDAAIGFKDFAVVPDVDMEVDEERAFVDGVSEKLLVTVAIW